MLTLTCASAVEREHAVTAAVGAARRGDLVYLPTESVYAIATDPFSTRGLSALRAIKGQEAGSPVPIMVPNAQTVAGITTGGHPLAQALMQAFWPGPLTLLLPPQPTLAWDLPVGRPVAVRMPLHPVTLAVLARSGPLAVTTANAPGQAPPRSLAEAIEQLGESAALGVDAGVLSGDELASTVLDLTGAVPVIVRQGALSIEDLHEVAPDISA